MKCFCCDFIAEFKKGFVYWRKVLSSFFQLLYAISLFRLFINENSCSRNANAMYGVFSCQLSLRPSSHEIWTCLDNKATPLIRPIFFLTHWWSFQRGSLYHYYHCPPPLALTTVFTATNTTTASPSLPLPLTTTTTTTDYTSTIMERRIFTIIRVKMEK